MTNSKKHTAIQNDETACTFDEAKYLPDFKVVEQHLDYIEGSDAVYDFRSFAPKGYTGTAKAAKKRGTLKDCRRWIKRQVANKLGVYLSVNEMDGRGVKRENIQRIRAIFREYDDYKDGYDGRKNLPLAPTFVVETSPGATHDWFMLSDGEELTVEEFRGVMRRMIVEHDSDPGAKDETRVLRLAGTYNTKKEHGEPFQVRILEKYTTRDDDGYLRDYTRAEILQAFPLMSEQEFADWDAARKGKTTQKKKTKGKRDGKSADKSKGAALEPTKPARVDVVDLNWDADVVRDALKCIDPDDGGYSTWLSIVWSVSTGCAGADIGLEILDNWSERSKDYDYDELCQKYHDPSQRGEITLGTLFGIARDNGWVPPSQRALVVLPQDDGDSSGAGRAGQAVERIVDDVEWREVVNLKNPARSVGDPQSFENVKQYLELEDLKLRYNEFDMCIYAVDGCGNLMKLEEAHLANMSMRMHIGGCRVTEAFFLRSANYIARCHQFHPVRDYLNSLQWDGVPRLGSFLIEYAGGKDTDFVKAIGIRWVVAGVRRVFQPGYKFDTMLVLEGAQGIGKSSFLQVLASEPWFGDATKVGFNAKEIIETTQGTWIVECAEMAGLRRNEVEEVKTFVSRSVDKARLAYARSPIEVPRQFVLAGTTNDWRYLQDKTGNRRIWPFEAGISGPIMLDKLRQDRDQLFAEAVKYAFDENFKTTLSTAQYELAKVEQEIRRVLSPEEEALTDMLGPDCFADYDAIFVTKEDVHRALGY